MKSFFEEESLQKGMESNARRLKEILAILLKYEITKGMTPKKLRQIIEDLGPTFIKIGQIMSMRGDVFSQDYCVELQKLQANVRPMTFEEVIGMMREEYQEAPDQIFKKIDREPLGSASIAQVHSAILMDGSEVVVKVQRPGIYYVMSQDVSLIHKATGILKIASGSMGNVLDFKMILNEMWTTAQEEMDFLNEAQNAKLFYELNQKIQYITCPKIYDEFTTPKVLVMEKIYGIEIDKKEELIAAGYDLNEIGIKLAENYVKQIIDDGFFHADPHPGNIFIREGKIVWIDLGMMGSLSKRDKGLFRRSVKAVALGDAEGLESVILALGIRRGSRINRSKLYEGIDEMLEEYGTESLEHINIGRFMEEMLKIASDNNIAMPSGISMLSRGTITIEGVIVDMTPEINVVQIMKNHMAGEEFENFDVETFIQNNGRKLLISTKKATEIPGQISDFLKLANKGQLKMNLEITGSEEPLAEIDKMVNKIVICIINAALLIGSSFIATTDMTPKLMGIPALGTIGYIGAMILGGNLIFSTLKKKKGR